MNLCNVCKKYFNEPHDCTTTREEKLPKSVWIPQDSVEVFAAHRPFPNKQSYQFVSIPHLESLMREARALERLAAYEECAKLVSTSNDRGDVCKAILKKAIELEQATKARKE